VNKGVRRIIFGTSLRRTLIRASVLAVATFVVFKFLLLPVRISGISMEPTYRNGSINFINTLRYWRHTPDRGDVISIRMAGRRVMLFKRIIGLPGERLSFANGTLLINGKVIPEPYLNGNCSWDMPEIIIGPNEFFVAGDNRGISMDEHTYGRVEYSRIVGEVLF